MKLIKTPSLFALILVPIVGMMMGCQNTPTVDPNSPDNINLGGEVPSHSMLEVSYLCNNKQSNNNQSPNGQLISVFYDSRHTPTNDSQQASSANNTYNQRVTLRMGDNDYPMQSMAENTYISQQATADGHWLIWHAPISTQGKLIVSKTADMQQVVSQQLCKVTR
ncbi:hypothetical protein [Psychrobacter sp. I-STPA10]|uniref:hypothetical protein n=1 Tax=Psychrobacter sp. I-STPA10 TaxID=2585769 RepID=UPI001E2B116D|nr:hypothetical protein [Psychrobacter sp. I-STPA10]